MFIMKKLLLSLLVCLPCMVFASEPTFMSKVNDSIVNQNNHILSVARLEELYQNKQMVKDFILNHPDKAIIIKSYFSFRDRISEKDYKAMQTVVKDEEDLEKTFTWQNIYFNLDKNLNTLSVKSDNTCDYASHVLVDPKEFKLNNVSDSFVIEHNPTQIGDVSTYFKLDKHNSDDNIDLMYVPSIYSLELFLTNQDKDINDESDANLHANSTAIAINATDITKQSDRTFRVKGIYYSFEDVQDLKVATLKNLATWFYYSNHQKDFTSSLQAIYKRNQSLCLFN
jgi:hypothetical protein